MYSRLKPATTLLEMSGMNILVGSLLLYASIATRTISWAPSRAAASLNSMCVSPGMRVIGIVDINFVWKHCVQNPTDGAIH